MEIMARQRKTTKAAATKSRVPEMREPIFGDQVSDIIPGEVIVQLFPETNAQITEAIPTAPSRGHLFAGTSSFGVSDLDSVLADLQTTSITRLTPPAPTMTATSEAFVALASTFKVRYESKTSAQTAVERLSNVDGVVY